MMSLFVIFNDDVIMMSYPPLQVYSEGVVMAEEDKASGGVTLMTYFHYLVAGGGYLLILLTTVVFLMGEVSLILTDLWLAEWWVWLYI